MTQGQGLSDRMGTGGQSLIFFELLTVGWPPPIIKKHQSDLAPKLPENLFGHFLHICDQFPPQAGVGDPANSVTSFLKKKVSVFFLEEWKLPPRVSDKSVCERNVFLCQNRGPFL